MILELVHIDVLPDHHEQFEQDLATAAATVLPQARGFVEFTPAGWCVERPDVYVFTLEDHTQGFRDSALFEQWRALIGPHFAQPPVVEHYAR